MKTKEHWFLKSSIFIQKKSKEKVVQYFWRSVYIVTKMLRKSVYYNLKFMRIRKGVEHIIHWDWMHTNTGVCKLTGTRTCKFLQGVCSTLNKN